MVDAYKYAIQNVQLWGPTNVAPIIYHVARFAEQAQKQEADKGAHVSIFYNMPTGTSLFFYFPKIIQNDYFNEVKSFVQRILHVGIGNWFS